MAPRVAVRRERENDFSAVGKVGRRTGITLQHRPVDENGIEEITGIFSSPRKPSPLRKSFHAHDVETDQSMSGTSTGMIGIDSPGLTPSQLISTRKSLRALSVPPPRSASPKKSGISGSPRRSNIVDRLPEKDQQTYDPEEQENSQWASQSTIPPSTMRRFSPTPEKSPLRDISTNTRTIMNTGKAKPKGFGVEDVVFSNKTSTADTMAQDLYKQSKADDAHDSNADLNSDDGRDIVANADDEQLLNTGEEYEEFEEPALPALSEQHDDYEEADQPLESQSDVPVDESGPTRANSRKKRKSEAMDQDAQYVDQSSPAAKKARKIAADVKKRLLEVPGGSSTTRAESPRQSPQLKPTEARGRHLGKKQAPSATTLSAQQEAELEQIVEKVKARPGQSKSLYILRRETPTEDGATHTRSGRVSVKPLAYWRNEKCVYGGSPGSSSLHDGARFPLNSIKEIIRTDEVETTASKSKVKQRARKGKGKACEAFSDSEDDGSYEDPDAEPWESEVGTFRGKVSVWDEQLQAPLEDEQQEVDMAYAPAAIQTSEVPGSTFQYAKLLSTRFFGSGIVDLPPGGVKRPKNSRKMHMSFFVAKGRVTVQMGPLGGEERFSVGKCGFWQVPRGNQYSIENELEKPARIFFSQACEIEIDAEE